MTHNKDRIRKRELSCSHHTSFLGILLSSLYPLTGSQTNTEEEAFLWPILIVGRPNIVIEIKYVFIVGPDKIIWSFLLSYVSTHSPMTNSSVSKAFRKTDHKHFFFIIPNTFMCLRPDILLMYLFRCLLILLLHDDVDGRRPCPNCGSEYFIGDFQWIFLHIQSSQFAVHIKERI